MNENYPGQTKDLQKKIWITTSIVALFVLLIWLFIEIFSVLLLVLAGTLIALYFHGLSGIIHRKTNLGKKASLIISVTVTILVILTFFYFAGNTVAKQASELQDTMPSVVKKFENDLSKNPIGQKLLQRLQSADTGKFIAYAQRFFSSTFGVLGDVYVILFIGLFFTTSPHTYLNGFVLLVPASKREQAKTILQNTGSVLIKWLKGKLFAMIIVAVLTFIGLVIMDVPMAFVLSIIAGVLNFIPNFGPLIAMIPAVLVGLMQSPVTALLIIALYIVIQVIESNFITPQIQKKLISMPSALIIIAQVMMGVLTGGWGVLLATPLMAMLIVIVKETYIKD